ncbi:hypothetical protein EK21DRAFT_79737 [Setomelanomma holmii]|uniref:Peptidase M14 domain-containing protein n=1 Tax=Setomelanomma holmii TaxID=210430 RepID=A0A9P4GYQ6_9PLEO|nr:hypothetical protein EK21DRAFT_79737 [Setomelanomma holmii]
MKLALSLLWLLLATAASLRSSPASAYDGSKVYRIKAGRNIASIHERLAGIASDTWDQAHGNLDVVIPRGQIATFEALRLKTRVLHADLGESIAKEYVVKRKNWRQSNDSQDPWFDSYHPYADHVEWWRDLQGSFSNQSNLTSSGTSYEGRDIFGLHLWGAGGPRKPAVLYHGTVHAREWIATPIIEYVAQQLVEGYMSGNNITQAFLNNYDFYIFPFVKPDGFVYSQTNERPWRKNRQPPPANAPNQTCFGRDVNRNWETNWDAEPRGASPNPCSQTYRGVVPRDAPENGGLDDFVRKTRDAQGIKLFIDWHSYSRLILSPFRHKETLYAPQLGKWTKAAVLVSEAIRAESTNATTFTFGPSGVVLYPTTGSSVDHIYTISLAEFSYTIELPDYGDFGFVLPPERIRPTVEGQWVGQQVLLSLLDEEFFNGEGPAILTL